MPEYAYNQGDEVRIRESARYGNRWKGYTGVIAGSPFAPGAGPISYPVRIDGIVNKDSATGRFWFHEEDLEMASLAQDNTKLSPPPDYSKIMRKTPAELGIQKEMALLDAGMQKKKEKEMVVFNSKQEAIQWALEQVMIPDPTEAITNVIFNPPATIVFWRDNTKTIVKCGANDIYEPEVGLAMAISKKYFGNTGQYRKVFKKWVPEPEATDVEMLADFKWILSKLPNPEETVHTDGQRFCSISDILREGMMSLYFKEHSEELRFNDNDTEKEN